MEGGKKMEGGQRVEGGQRIGERAEDGAGRGGGREEDALRLCASRRRLRQVSQLKGAEDGGREEDGGRTEDGGQAEDRRDGKG